MDQQYRSPTRDLGGYRNGAASAASSLSESASEIFDARPLITICAVFGAGLALGVGLGELFAQSCPHRTTPQSLAGRISDAVWNAIPEQLRSGLGSA